MRDRRMGAKRVLRGFVGIAEWVGILGSLATMAGCWPLTEGVDCGYLLNCSSGASSSSGGGGAPSGCVPSDSMSPVGDGCGVFVSSSMGADAGAGTKAAPVKTLAAAITQAKGGRVYACAEAFTEAVTLVEGVTIFGGLDCVEFHAATQQWYVHCEHM